MKTVHCEECSHFTFPKYFGSTLMIKAECNQKHKVRFYNPKANNYMDDDYGWKKKCGDFKLSKRVIIAEFKEVEK